MAKMIPARPRDFAKESLENLIFEGLEKLPDDYYVIHSFRLVTVENGTIFESEADFIIYNRTKGILCIEAKAGHVQYINGDWYYGSGIKMSHDGPYNQAAKNKWTIKNYIQNSPYYNLLGKCKLLHGVWFPSISADELVHKVMPPEADIHLTLTRSDLENPLSRIEEVFAMELPNHIQTNLTEHESNLLVQKILCPSFDLIPSISIEHDLKKQVFHKMLIEQKNVLNYLVFQRSAVIQGVAGTGKTLIALEKARRHADDGQKVLFLCYNRFLHSHISKNNPNVNIDYYTIDGFACKMCHTAIADYGQLKEVLEECYLNQNFPYEHIIIDEGQDFGQENIEENEIISLLEDIILDGNNENGTFYIFYDAMQLVQGSKIPDYILNADCKLTLYKNCRNTENIATTSMKPIRDRKPKLMEGCLKGSIPKMFFCSDTHQEKQQIFDIIKSYEQNGLSDIVVLTCKTESSSILCDVAVDGKINDKYAFTTCRKFKGLEADAIIISDITPDVLTSEAAKIFYVGASRARLYLSMVCSLSEEQCESILNSYSIKPKFKRIKKQLATALNSTCATLSVLRL